MKNKYHLIFIILICVYSQNSLAKSVQDVSVESIQKTKDGVVVKLSTMVKSKPTYFFVDFFIHKKNKEHFKKMSVILKRMTSINYKMNLDIVSFSPFPAGSIYKSSRVKFEGAKYTPKIKSQKAGVKSSL